MISHGGMHASMTVVMIVPLSIFYGLQIVLLCKFFFVLRQDSSSCARVFWSVALEFTLVCQRIMRGRLIYHVDK